MLTRFFLNDKKSFIGAWMFTDLDICNTLIKYFDESPDKHQGGFHKETGGYIDKSIKDSVDLNLPPTELLSQQYAAQLQQVTNEYIKVYDRANCTGSWCIEAMNIQKYDPGGAYFGWHTERVSIATPSVFRHLVFMTYLNDVTDEGETEFLYQEVKVKPKKGLTLIWPSDWTHTHRGIASTTQSKYIVTGWYGFYQK